MTGFGDRGRATADGPVTPAAADTGSAVAAARTGVSPRSRGPAAVRRAAVRPQVTRQLTRRQPAAAPKALKGRKDQYRVISFQELLVGH